MKAISLGLALMAPLGAIDAASSAAASARSMFDLTCMQVESGMEVAGEYHKNEKREGAIREIRISVNLADKVWCHQPCRIRGELEETNTEIRMSGGPMGLGASFYVVGRDTGLMMQAVQINRTISLMNTFQCRRVKFTAIPAQKF